MSPLLAATVPLLAAYLLGSVPFGYLIGRARGVNLFRVGTGNLGAVAVLAAARLLGTPEPFGPVAPPVTLYALLGSLLVVVKHRSNLRRLAAGTENQIGDSPMRHTILRGLHVVALGLWVGGAVMFNF